MEEVKSKSPELFSSITKLGGEDIDWEEVKEDLEKLNWLEQEKGKEKSIVDAVWEVVDSWGVSQIEGRPRFKVTKINRVKLFVASVIYNLNVSKEAMREICLACQKNAEQLEFYNSAKSMVSSMPESSLEECVQGLHETYLDLKNTYNTVLMHIDKYLSMELHKDLKTLLDEQFYKKVISPIKAKLMSNSKTRQIVSLYDKNYYWSGTSYGSLGYSSWSSYPRENTYLGELDQEGKRQGYGTISYFNGDSYEGFWENDKPHGKGIYKWKIGGTYEGDFLDGQLHGFGKRIYSSGNVYAGQFEYGKKKGKGEMYFANGDFYEGDWDDDDLHGEGTYRWKTGDSYVGGFYRDRRKGEGVLSLSNGEVYSGYWKDGSMESSS